MMVRAQRVLLPSGELTWTVLGADHLPVPPVEMFLEHRRQSGGSPNTVRSYSRALALTRSASEPRAPAVVTTSTVRTRKREPRPRPATDKSGRARVLS